VIFAGEKRRRAKQGLRACSSGKRPRSVIQVPDEALQAAREKQEYAKGAY